MERYIIVVFKLMISVILGGLVGYERQFKNRPAGLRTHILVCIGATLVQIISVDYYSINNFYNSDPMRLGAQVISGIGFLGAGTILKEGINVKGLTTAASLWVVACIGLSIGSGLYFESIVATIFIYFCLKWIKDVEKRLVEGKRYITLKIIVRDQPGVIGEIASFLGKRRINIIYINLERVDDYYVEVELTVNMPYMQDSTQLINEISTLDVVENINMEEE